MRKQSIAIVEHCAGHRKPRNHTTNAVGEAVAAGECSDEASQQRPKKGERRWTGRDGSDATDTSERRHVPPERI